MAYPAEHVSGPPPSARYGLSIEGEKLQTPRGDYVHTLPNGDIFIDGQVYVLEKAVQRPRQCLPTDTGSCSQMCTTENMKDGVCLTDGATGPWDVESEEATTRKTKPRVRFAPETLQETVEKQQTSSILAANHKPSHPVWGDGQLFQGQPRLPDQQEKRKLTKDAASNTDSSIGNSANHDLQTLASDRGPLEKDSVRRLSLPESDRTRGPMQTGDASETDWIPTKISFPSQPCQSNVTPMAELPDISECHVKAVQRVNVPQETLTSRSDPGSPYGSLSEASILTPVAGTAPTHTMVVMVKHGGQTVLTESCTIQQISPVQANPAGNQDTEPSYGVYNVSKHSTFIRQLSVSMCEWHHFFSYESRIQKETKEIYSEIVVLAVCLSLYLNYSESHILK